MWSPKRKMWSPRLKNVESKIAFLLQEISYFEPYLIQYNLHSTSFQTLSTVSARNLVS